MLSSRKMWIKYCFSLCTHFYYPCFHLILQLVYLLLFLSYLLAHCLQVLQLLISPPLVFHLIGMHFSRVLSIFQVSYLYSATYLAFLLVDIFFISILQWQHPDATQWLQTFLVLNPWEICWGTLYCFFLLTRHWR